MNSVLAFIGGVLIPSIAAAVKWWFARKDKRAREHVPKLLNKVHKFYGVLNELQSDLNAKKVLLLKVSNGGAVPNVSSPLFASVLYTTGSGELRTTWNNQLVDGPYLEMLLSVARDDKVHLNTAELAPGILKNAYLSMNIGSSEVFRVLNRPSAMFYISIIFEEETELSPIDYEKTRAAVNILQGLLS